MQVILVSLLKPNAEKRDAPNHRAAPRIRRGNGNGATRTKSKPHAIAQANSVSRAKETTRSIHESRHETSSASALSPNKDDDEEKSSSKSSLSLCERSDESAEVRGDRIRFSRDAASPMRSRVTSSGADETQCGRRSGCGTTKAAALAASIDMAVLRRRALERVGESL